MKTMIAVLAVALLAGAAAVRAEESRPSPFVAPGTVVGVPVTPAGTAGAPVSKLARYRLAKFACYGSGSSRRGISAHGRCLPASDWANRAEAACVNHCVKTTSGAKCGVNTFELLDPCP